MNCETAFELISGHIDGQNTVEEETALQAHLSACKDCRDLLALMCSIDSGVKSLAAEPPAALKQSVMERIQTQPVRKKRSRLGPGTAIGAIAAVLVLMVGTGVIRLPQRGSSTAPEKVLAESAAPEESNVESPTYGAAPLMRAPEDAEYETYAESMYFASVGAEPEAAESTRLEAAGYDVYDGTNAQAAEKRSLTASQALFTKEDFSFCSHLSEAHTAPLLAFYGLDGDFPAQLAALCPELGALLEDAPMEERDGKYVIELSVDAVFAIHEWLSAALPQMDEAEEDLPAESEQAAESMVRRITAFDPDNGCLTTVITLADPAPQYDWPEQWPEDFAACFRAEENWALYYPSEDFLPEHGDLAYLVLIPVPEQEPLP